MWCHISIFVDAKQPFLVEAVMFGHNNKRQGDSVDDKVHRVVAGVERGEGEQQDRDD